MSKLYLNHKRVFIASVVLILSVVLVTFLAIYFVAINKEKTPIAIDENGTELISGKVYDMPSNLMFTSDVSEVSDNDGILLKATVKPITAVDKRLKWSVAWKDTSETFAASNGDVSQFVTVKEVSSDTAEIKCLKPFGSKIVINVVSVFSPKAKATCVVDYVRKPDQISMQLNATSVAYPQNPFARNIIMYDPSNVNASTKSIDFASAIFYDPSYASDSNQSMEINTVFNDKIYTIEDNVADYNIKIEPSEIVKNYYKGVLGSSNYFKIGEYTKNTDKQHAVDLFLEVIGFSPYVSAEPADYNDLITFYQNHVNQVFYTVSYTITMESGLIYSGTQNYTFTQESIGLVAESIELDKGSIKL